ncbi:Kinesin-like protein 6 [Sphaceloma murrayae]|uniref:Kinesin-like protein 6 n=1 Tax=Sphaceloma murrayae TaxID=2082308 RepID=A0A2K1QR82_9PEZI|nr:Kinesin-like protein 6 [Sphaceloma murrayae]
MPLLDHRSFDDAVEGAGTYVAKLDAGSVKELVDLTRFPQDITQDEYLADYVELSLPYQSLAVQRKVMAQVDYHREHHDWNLEETTHMTGSQSMSSPEFVTIASSPVRAWDHSLHRNDHNSEIDIRASQVPKSHGATHVDWSDAVDVDDVVSSPLSPTRIAPLGLNEHCCSLGRMDIVDLTQEEAILREGDTRNLAKYGQTSTPDRLDIHESEDVALGMSSDSPYTGLTSRYFTPSENWDGSPLNTPVTPGSPSDISGWLGHRRFSSMDQDDPKNTPCPAAKRPKLCSASLERSRFISPYVTEDRALLQTLDSVDVDHAKGIHELSDNPMIAPQGSSHAPARSSTHLVEGTSIRRQNGDYFVAMPENTAVRLPPSAREALQKQPEEPSQHQRQRSWSMTSSLYRLDALQPTDQKLAFPQSPDPEPFDIIMVQPTYKQLSSSRSIYRHPSVKDAHEEPHDIDMSAPIASPLFELLDTPGLPTPPGPQRTESVHSDIPAQRLEEPKAIESVLTFEKYMTQRAKVPLSTTARRTYGGQTSTTPSCTDELTLEAILYAQGPTTATSSSTHVPSQPAPITNRDPRHPRASMLTPRPSAPQSTSSPLNVQTQTDRKAQSAIHQFLKSGPRFARNLVFLAVENNSRKVEIGEDREQIVALKRRVSALEGEKMVGRRETRRLEARVGELEEVVRRLTRGTTREGNSDGRGRSRVRRRG